MSHFRSMADYQEAECDAGRHVWGWEPYGDWQPECFYCHAPRCLHAEIVRGREVGCGEPMQDGSEMGYCAEHEREDLQVSARLALADMAKEETPADRRDAFEVALRCFARLISGTETAQQAEMQQRRYEYREAA